MGMLRMIPISRVSVNIRRFCR